MPQPWRPTRAFSLLELVIVVAILGVLAAIAAPRLAGAGQNSARASAVASLRNMAGAFSMYYEQSGDWPVTALAGAIPPGMSEFLPAQVWAQTPALGERWVWINDPMMGVGVGMGVTNAADWRARWREFDIQFDDGALTSGMVQAWASAPPALVWIIEDATGPVGGVAPIDGGKTGASAATAIDGG